MVPYQPSEAARSFDSFIPGPDPASDGFTLPLFSLIYKSSGQTIALSKL